MATFLSRTASYPALPERNKERNMKYSFVGKQLVSEKNENNFIETIHAWNSTHNTITIGHKANLGTQSVFF